MVHTITPGAAVAPCLKPGPRGAGMPGFVRLLRGWLLLALCLLVAGAGAQPIPPKVAKVEIRFVGPQSVSEELVRSNIRVKAGDPYLPTAVDEDVQNLYATGLFYNIQVAQNRAPEGLVLTYIVQGKPRLTEIRFEGNKKFSDAKISKKISSRTGQPLDERKLFLDVREIEQMYEKAGYPRTKVEYAVNIEEAAGRGTATFRITESPKIKIVRVEFPGVQAFSEKKLRKVVKTRKRWMFSWITGSGKLKEEQLEDDRERLAEFYRNEGYIDFELKDVQLEYPTARSVVVRFLVNEGKQYRVGAVSFEGNKIFSTAEITNGLTAIHAMNRTKGPFGPHNLPMDVGDVFTPKGLAQDSQAVEDFYGAKGYIDVGSGRTLNVLKVPNVQTGTMDLVFRIEEGQQSYIERIDIRGNTKTKDRVIRRELAVSPGEVFDMVRVRRSKLRLEGLQYFEKVDTRPEPSDIPNRKHLVVGVDEKNTGNLSLGAGFSSVDAIVGFVELTQGNFDLFHPPTFTGGGQKFRLRVQIGTERQDYLASFIEPWFLGRKLALGVDLYYRDLGYESLNNLYDVTRAGGRVSLTRALGSDFLIGSVSYTLENVGIEFNDYVRRPLILQNPGQGRDLPSYFVLPPSVPMEILRDEGDHLLPRYGGSLAYDTRNSVQLPDKGQRTELSAEIVAGPPSDDEFYKLELKTSWYFRGFATGHVLELVGRTGVAAGIGSSRIPFFERYYLGGLYSLRGYEYRSVSPREDPYDEPIGGSTYWFTSAEYSIPIIDRLRFAVFYDAGAVAFDDYDYTDTSLFNDNWGVGLRLNLPIGPLRLDYGIPITTDRYNDSSGRFQFGVGYTREF